MRLAAHVRDGRLVSTRERERLSVDRTATRIRRTIDARHPGGTWSYVLAARDRAEILLRWER